MKKRWNRLLVLSLVLSTGLTKTARAEGTGLDSASQEGLDKTVQMLNDRTAREKAAKETTSGAAAHAEVQKLGGAETQDAVYGLSGDIMKGLVQQTGGDPAKLQDLMAKAQKDPEGFAKSLPAEQQAKISGIAERMPTSTAQIK